MSSMLTKQQHALIKASLSRNTLKEEYVLNGDGNVVNINSWERKPVFPLGAVFDNLISATTEHSYHK